MRVLTPETIDLALDAYDQARIVATATGSVGATFIHSKGDVEVRAIWHRRDEVADHKHVAKEVRR
ncbi:hypothetical protein SEA_REDWATTLEHOG_58 [Gordonia phage RedWattleHog]|uniref:Uncharacterized protein n=1 Tax=Gordonia phage Stormageddon TaxID=2656541 RepID=A0A649VRH8_9CAUD|nr:hypothetical protein KHQ86_gp055 [Gordonia phage Stormageddon]QGJ94918.1 hypothetical protein SEA_STORMAGEDDON_55 [Gordonia phage Stormageddon]QLF83562.1 hypothetical protein SEA_REDWATTLEHOG_58 [Gordonia phage RedWattleHog]